MTDADQGRPPETGPIRLFMDDDRDAPRGWTLVRSNEAFVEALDTVDGSRLEAISLDWHLGRDMPNGNVALDALIDRLRRHPDRYPILDRVHFHSSDHPEAVMMTRRFADFIRETIDVWRIREGMIMMDASMPWDED